MEGAGKLNGENPGALDDALDLPFSGVVIRFFSGVCFLSTGEVSEPLPFFSDVLVIRTLLNRDRRPDCVSNQYAFKCIHTLTLLLFSGHLTGIPTNCLEPAVAGIQNSRQC